ncbi:hypothetical protein L1080_016885 [Rhodococcus sp. MSC1_016]|uniref:hypothetical protein n=1 Tax=Rhodococcus sp. MSC1_016 TaxID=2909266 RepID=UPI0027E05887|nr:hypothetical protein [Rhodococcus sp. MSC1_016]
MTRQTAHRPLFTEETGTIDLVQVSREDLHSDYAVQVWLCTLVHDTEATLTDLHRMFEPGRSQLRGEINGQVTLRSKWVARDHPCTYCSHRSALFGCVDGSRRI